VTQDAEDLIVKKIDDLHADVREIRATQGEQWKVISTQGREIKGLQVKSGIISVVSGAIAGAVSWFFGGGGR
jgi:hypothetical protein